jgi:hypothetical protein
VTINQIERREMARAEQATAGHAAEAQIGLLVWARPFTGRDVLAVANKQQIGGIDPYAKDRLVGKPLQRQDLDPSCFRFRHAD